jgi:geranylgeranylglycerol-phosphate geranylgeranyltransferase
MNFIKIFFLLLSTVDVFSLKLPNKLEIRMNKKEHISKAKSYFKLIRYENIIPTSFLSFSGAFITSKKFFPIQSIPSNIITVLIMCYSMITNDLFDLNIDRINNPSRPLVSGKIKKYEALILNIFILVTIFFLSSKYLSYCAQNILNIMIIMVTLYTPIFKKIPFVKNIFCSFIVAFSLLFSGIATNNNILNDKLLYIASSYIFLGSLSNELLLDVLDYEGDKKNKINTLPILFGKLFTIKLSKNLILINILFNLVILAIIYNINIALPIFFFSIEHYIKFNIIVNNNYSIKILKNIVNESNIPLLSSLIYFCIISKF